MVLFTTENIEVSEVNSYLHSQWITNLVSIDSIIKLKEIPLLWTGKTDYVQLKWILQSSTTKRTSKTKTKVTEKKSKTTKKK
jgi:hypothetical protein